MSLFDVYECLSLLPSSLLTVHDYSLSEYWRIFLLQHLFQFIVDHTSSRRQTTAGLICWMQRKKQVQIQHEGRIAS